MEGKHGWSWTYFKLAFIIGILRLLFTPFLFIADLVPKRLPPGIVKEEIKVPSRDVGRFIKVHIYKPLQQNPSNYQVLLPVHLNFFGSGYLFDTHGKDWKFCSYFAKRLNMIVLDCDYRTFPYAFPSAYNDCVDLVKWCSSQKDRGWDVNKISIAGRSSGGNLALSVSSTFPDLIKSVVSLYPPTDFRISATDERFLKSPSQVSRAGMPLTRSMLKLCDQAYVLPGIDREDPRLSVIFGKASSFPQHVWVACGNADILYNDSKQFISNLQRDGHPNAVLMSVENEGHAWDELAKKGSISERKKNEAYDAICRTIQSGWTDSRGEENHKTDEE